MVASNMPAADIDVTAELVRSLLEIQHPELADLDIAPLANGWDNVLYRIGPDLVARLPRREASVALVDHECRWLPELAPRLPVPVPVPVRGRGHRLLPVAVDDRPVDRGGRYRREPA